MELLGQKQLIYLLREVIPKGVELKQQHFVMEEHLLVHVDLMKNLMELAGPNKMI